MIKHDPFSILKSQNTGIWILHKLIKYQSRILTLLLIGVIALVISMSSFSRVQFAQHQHAQMNLPADILIMKNLLLHKTTLHETQIEARSSPYCEISLEEEKST